MVRRIDDLFHHIEEDVAGWMRHPRSAGNGYSRHHGPERSPLTGSMAALETSLHHLLKDAGIRRAPLVDPAPPPPVEWSFQLR
jgi:hypothetical protein